MTWRTPAALCWMIRKHARLHGAIQAQEKAAADLAAVLEERHQSIRDARARLEALEQTLQMHQIKVEPGEIAPVRPRNPSRVTRWRHGELTRLIYASLRDAGDWTRTADLLERATGVTPENTEREEYNHVRRVFRCRLQGLYREGKIERRICEQWSGTDQRHNQTLWRLPD